jgi:NAD(P)-dependent dehydrogenase (short-subunit alcohol dehydrogenase family)
MVGALGVARSPMPARTSSYSPSVQPSDILVNDQVAIVTGSGAGIGQGIAVGLAQFGADVVIAEIDPDRAEVTAGRIRAEGRQALVVPTDMADVEQVQAMVAAAVERFGRVDILVNNAGGVRPGKFVEQSERSWRRHIDLNLISMLAATSEVSRLMIEAGRGGSIVNVASIEALRAAPHFAVYAACKAAMTNFTRTAAVELGEHGIRVNALAPDLIATPGIRGIIRGPVPDPLPGLTAEAEAGVPRYVPLGHEGVVEDCAAAAIFLSSPMGRYVSGTTMNIDGGTWASSGWTRTPGKDGWQLFGGSEMGISAPG